MGRPSKPQKNITSISRGPTYLMTEKEIHCSFPISKTRCPSFFQIEPPSPEPRLKPPSPSSTAYHAQPIAVLHRRRNRLTYLVVSSSHSFSFQNNFRSDPKIRSSSSFLVANSRSTFYGGGLTAPLLPRAACPAWAPQPSVAASAFHLLLPFLWFNLSDQHFRAQSLRSHPLSS